MADEAVLEQAGVALGLQYHPRVEDSPTMLYFTGQFVPLPAWLALYGHLGRTAVHVSMQRPAKLARIGLLVEARIDPAFDFQFPPSTMHHVARQRALWTEAMLTSIDELGYLGSTRVKNDAVTVFRAVTGDVPTVVAIVRGAARLAEMCDARRGLLPIAPELVQHEPVWRRAAESLGLQLTTAPFGLYGRLHGATVFAYVCRHPRGVGFEVTVRVRFDQPLNLELSVQRKTMGARFFTALGAEDIETGDDAFDDAFRVRGADPEAVRRLLSDGVRRAYGALEQRHPVTLDDEGLMLRVLDVGRPEMIPEVVRTSVALMQAIQALR